MADETTDEEVTPPEASFVAPEIDYEAMYNAEVDAAAGMADANLERYPLISETALDSTLSAASNLQRQQNQQFANTINAIDPEYRKYAIGLQRLAIDQTMDLANQISQGATQPELFAVNRAMGKTDYSMGIFGASSGERYGNAVAEDQMSRTLQANSLMLNASTQAGRYQASVLGSMPPQTNVGALYEGAVQGLTKVATGSPGASQQSMSDAALANQQLAWSQQMSQYNASWDQYMMQQNAQLAQDQARSTQMSGIFGLPSALLGGFGATNS